MEIEDYISCYKLLYMLINVDEKKLIFSLVSIFSTDIQRMELKYLVAKSASLPAGNQMQYHSTTAQIL